MIIWAKIVNLGYYTNSPNLFLSNNQTITKQLQNILGFQKVNSKRIVQRLVYFFRLLKCSVFGLNSTKKTAMRLRNHRRSHSFSLIKKSVQIILKQKNRHISGIEKTSFPL